MNQLQAIEAIYYRHPIFSELSSVLRANILNAMGAAWTAGNQARPDYNPPTFHRFDSEKQSESAETTAKAQIFADAMPVPDDPHEASAWYDAVFERLQEVA